MKLFEVQTTLTSYTYPVVKIVICLSVIVLCLIRNHFLRFTSLRASVIVTSICFILTIVSILCLYISVGELFHTFANRQNSNYQPLAVKQLPIGRIVKIVSENDIVDIEVYTENKTISIGASSECKYASSIFENKLFYISSLEYDTIDSFMEALIELFPEGSIPVSKIDGLPLH